MGERIAVESLMVPVVRALLILTTAFLLSRLSTRLLRASADRVEFLRTAGGIVQGVVRGIILGLGLLMVLDTLGFSITPLLASLGIGSLAVALGLQDTLANCFAGLYIVADHPIQVGDFVRLESGQEGYVTHIGWRSTRVRMLANNLVVLPNSKVISSVLTNYSRPDQELAVLVELRVPSVSDLGQIERVTGAVAKQIMQAIPGGVPGFEPFVRYHTVGESGIEFTVILRARQFEDQYLIKHEFIKALLARYRQEGIILSVPMTAVEFTPSTRDALRGR